MKEIINTSRWKDTPCLWIERINIVKMTILLKAIYRFYQIIMILFTELKQKNLKICMESQKTPNCQSNLDKDYTTKVQ